MFSLYTDGGGDQQTSGASAFILEEEGRVPVGFALYLGPSTNNEAEICAVLAGLSYLRVTAPAKSAVSWFSDSEYALKSGTEYIFNWQRNGWRTAKGDPVKNQGLWQAWLSLSRPFKITPHHVRGHSGHPQNEACDQVCTLVRSRYGELQPGERFDGVGGFDFTILDGEEYLKGLRADVPSDDLKVLPFDLERPAVLLKPTSLQANELRAALERALKRFISGKELESETKALMKKVLSALE